MIHFDEWTLSGVQNDVALGVKALSNDDVGGGHTSAHKEKYEEVRKHLLGVGTTELIMLHCALCASTRRILAEHLVDDSSLGISNFYAHESSV